MSVTAKAHTEQLRQVLKGSVNKNGDGNLEEHLQKLFNFLILHYPSQALEKLEEASYLIKEGKDLSSFLKISDDRDYTAIVKNLESYNQTMQKKFAKPQPDEDGNMPEEAGPVTYINDLMKESRIWQWAGIGFGEQECYRLQKSMKSLAETAGAESISFFGKITGTKSDYYICECKVSGEGDEGGDEPVEPDVEQGVGVNQYVYFVTNNSLSAWTKLPNLTPR
jgi:hypothetical protein